MNWFFESRAKRARRAQMKIYQREDQKSFDTKMDAIMRIARNNMKQAELGKERLPVREHVVVSYDDLLKIWDIASNAKELTPVQRKCR